MGLKIIIGLTLLVLLAVTILAPYVILRLVSV